MGFQQPQPTGFVGAHLAAEAHYVGEHDSGQSASLWLRHRAVLSFVEVIIPPALAVCQPA